MLNVNVRGAKSKLDSIESLLVAKSIDIAGISETHLSEKEQLYLEGYHWYGQSRNKDGGGVGFFVSQRLVSLIEDMPDTCKSELKWINLRAKRNISIGIYYGPQENVDKTLLEEEYQRITDDINQNQKNNNIILMGDFNAKLQFDGENYHQSMSRNGRILLDMIKQTDMFVVNQSKYHEGTWTRINTRNQHQKSIIDYIMISENLSTTIIDSSTDTDGSFQIKGKNPSDHQCMFMTLNLMARQNVIVKKKWRIGSPKQWQDYNTYFNKLTETNMPTDVMDLQI